MFRPRPAHVKTELSVEASCTQFFCTFEEQEDSGLYALPCAGRAGRRAAGGEADQQL